MEHKEKEDFEFVKENNEEKGNYIFKKDSITRTGFYIIAIILIILVGITIYYGSQATE